MRKKKFRKITEKNIASIYGKIFGLKKRWVDPTNFLNVYATLMIISYNIDVSGCGYNDSILKCKYISKWDVSLNKDTIIIDLKKTFDRCNNWHLTVRLTVGDKIAFTGSTVKFKYDGIDYTIRLFGKYRRLGQMPDDFDGDILYTGKIRGEFLYKGPTKIYDKKQPMNFGTNLLSSDMIKNLDLEKMYPTAPPADSARGSTIGCPLFPPTPNNGVTAKQFKDAFVGYGSKPDPLNLPEFPDFTEDDLPPLEDLLSGVAELEHHIGEQNRSMEFKIPKNWDSPKKEEE